MKVHELVAVLATMPQDADVAIDAVDHYGDTDTCLVGQADLWVNSGSNPAGYVFLSASDTTVKGEKVSVL